jgi:plasmid maintenance system antidote protein VapI
MSPIEIRVLLLRLGLTISGLAEEFGCYRQELSMMINGRRYYPRLQEKFARKLGLTVEQLFGDRARKAA